MNQPARRSDFDRTAAAHFFAQPQPRPAARKQKVLIVENDPDLSRLLMLVGESYGFDTCHTPNGNEAIHLIANAKPAIVLLDWSIDGISGIEVCRRLRSDPGTRTLAIIMISGRGDEDDRIHGLTSGADDYMVKPFSSVELFARVRAILRRRSPSPSTEAVSYGDIILDATTRRVARAGKTIPLRPREFGLLQHLIARPCRVVTKDNLLCQVWGSDHVSAGAITQTVSRLRRALHIDGRLDPIRTVRSGGYSLDLDNDQRFGQ